MQSRAVEVWPLGLHRLVNLGPEHVRVGLGASQRLDSSFVRRLANG